MRPYCTSIPIWSLGDTDVSDVVVVAKVVGVRGDDIDPRPNVLKMKKKMLISSHLMGFNPTKKTRIS